MIVPAFVHSQTLPSAKHIPVVNQIEMHPFVWDKVEPLQSFMKKHGIRLEAYGPTVPVARNFGGTFETELNKVTSELSEKAGKTVEPSQVMLKLAQQRDAIIVTTSGKDWRMKQQLEAGAIPELSQEQIDGLQKSVMGHKRVFMPHMDEE